MLSSMIYGSIAPKLIATEKNEVWSIYRLSTSSRDIHTLEMWNISQTD